MQRHIYAFLVFICSAGLLLPATTHAGRNGGSTSSKGNVRRKSTRKIEEEEEKKEEKPSSSGNIRKSSSSGNVRRYSTKSTPTKKTTPVRTKKKSPTVHKTSNSTKRSTSNTGTRRTITTSNSKFSRTHSTSMKSTKPPRKTTVTTGRSTNKTGRNVRTYKVTGTTKYSRKDEKNNPVKVSHNDRDDISVFSRKSRRSTNNGHHRNRDDYDGRRRSRDDDIGNVRIASLGSYHDRNRVGNVSRSRDVGNVKSSHKKRNRHSIRRKHDYRRPRIHPRSYRYCWRGSWYYFPVRQGHYPRYFYYHTENNWTRMDRTVVYTEWAYNDYYDDRHTFVMSEDRGPRYEDREVEDYYDTAYVIKGNVEENIISKTILLSYNERDRVEMLLDKDIIQDVLASVDPDEENQYEYLREDRQFVVTAPEEVVMRIQTMIQNEQTFNAVYSRRDHLAVDVVTVVSPVFVDRDHRNASRLGARNHDKIEEYLLSLDRFYYSSGKKCWYNEDLGTVTIIDTEENLYRAWEHMNGLPYMPQNYLY